MIAEQSIQSWFETRRARRDDFLALHGWGNAALNPVGEDCAFRRYFRLTRDTDTAILMESIPDDHNIATPGHSLSDFVRIGTHLRRHNFHVPDIMASNMTDGYILLEDLGDTSFKTALQTTSNPAQIYGLAVDVLSHIRTTPALADIELPNYYDSHVHEGRRRIIDWYVPALRKTKNEDGLVQSYLHAWMEIEQSLPPCPQGFLHIDFHTENLMVVEGAQGNDRCGILDFQGAMIGPLPYDLANLLEDARMDMGDDLRQNMIARFCAQMNRDDKELFESWYRILATQFHCRVIGQFVRLAIKDGKERYLQHLPRLAGYINHALDDPVLRPLQIWLREHAITLDQSLHIDPAYDKNFIRADAF